VLGSNKQKMLRKAIERILANPKAENFNSLEIEQSVSAGTGRFPLIGFVTVSAHSRHVQESHFLPQPEDTSKLGRKSSSVVHDTPTASDSRSLSRETLEQSSGAPIPESVTA
jgi:hypothetical protein